MKTLTANIFVKDMSKTLEFYKTLGFDLNMRVPDEGEIIWCMMTCGKVNLMFQTFESLGDEIPDISRKDGGSLLLYILVENISDLHSRIKDKVKIIKDLEKTFYGATEFSIVDCNGYVLTFAENKESAVK